jgi:Uma2 family endonuclease
MATVTTKTIRGVEGDQCVELHDIDWKGYLYLLRLKGERSLPRMVYLDGTVWLMSPAFAHEKLKKQLGWLVEVIGEELDLPFVASASTTFCRRRKRGGVEGDQTYYLANESRVRGKKQIKLKIDPPPDLAIEVVYSHDADAAIEVYRRFKVPEVWICDKSEVVILIRRPNGRYARSSTSAAFPFLAGAEIHQWVTRPQAEADTEWIKALRRWVRDTLVPRARERSTCNTAPESQQTDGDDRKES